MISILWRRWYLFILCMFFSVFICLIICSVMKGGLFSNLIEHACLDPVSLDSPSTDHFHIIITKFVRWCSWLIFPQTRIGFEISCVLPKFLLLLYRLFFLSRIGGWSLPKLPLTKLCGPQFGTAFTIWFWVCCAWNPQPMFLMSWKLHFGLC